MDNHTRIEEQLKESLRDALKTLVVVAMAIFLLLLAYNGRVLLYINQRTAWLLVPTAIVLFVIAEAFRRRPTGAEHEAGCQCGDAHHPFAPLSLLLVALPVLLGMLVPPAPLGALAMGARDSVSFTAPASLSGNVADVEQGSERNILDWIAVFQRSSDLTPFAGKEAHVTGFVFRDDAAGADRFMVSRFIITCCVADAMPVGLPVRWPDAATLAPDQWVEVSGPIALEQVDGDTVPYIDATAVVPVNAPDQPYLYP